MDKAARNYPTHEQELLALVLALKEWKHYLMGPFIAETDHERLTSIFTQSNLSGRQARWLEVLQQFEVTIKHVPGVKNIVADCLSRRPNLADNLGINSVEIHLSDDGFLQNLVKAQKVIDPTTTKYELGEDKLWRDKLGRIVIPSAELRQQILRLYHDDPSSGHPGAEKLHQLIGQHFNWTNLDSDARTYTKGCDLCQRNKPALVSLGKLRPLSIPTKAWSHISCDFVTDLPLTNSQFDAIMVIVCRLSKMV